MFTNVGNLSITPCTATGVNTIALTPIASTPPPTYADNRFYLFRAAGTTIGPVTVNIQLLGQVNLFKGTDSNGNGVQAGSGDIVIGAYYLITYSSALSGFLILSETASSGGGGGGSGITGTVANNAVVIGTGASTVSATAQFNAGQLLVGQSLSTPPIPVSASGDISAVSAAGAFTIANAAVTNAKMALMNNNAVKGNVSGVLASPSDLTKAQLLSLLGISTFTSGAHTPVSISSAFSDAHGLGNLPTTFLAQGYLKCLTAELGYSIGDTVVISTINGFGGSSGAGGSVWVSNTNIGVTISGGNGMGVANKSTGQSGAITPANWSVYTTLVYFA